MKLYLLLVITILFVVGCNNTAADAPISNDTKAIIPDKSKTFAYGIDISRYQNNEIDIIHQQTDSLHFIICKATEGVTYTDPDFSQNWEIAKSKSYIRGAYHFYRSDDDPLQQANFYLTTIADIQSTDIPPIVDFEEGGINKTKSVEEIQSDLKKLLVAIETQSNRKPIIYTDLNTGNKYLNDSSFQKYPLWIANYNGKNSPDLPAVWKDKGWVFWQKTDHYTFDGTPDDFDKFNGDLTALKDFIENSNKKH